MGTTTVKTYQKRTKKGKVVTVHSHSMRTKDKKGVTKKVNPIVRLTKLAEKRIVDKGVAESIVKKYKERPHNLKLMVDGKWKNVIIDVWKTDSKGKRVKMKTVQRQLNFSNNDWAKFKKENAGLIYNTVKKYAFNYDMWDDLEAAAVKSLFEAANNYEAKFNPSNPPDIFKHLRLHMNGSVRWELTKLLATKFQLPPQKNVVFGKFKEAFDKYGGDYDAIYKELKLKRKDLYPNINEVEGEKLLPREGYVTVKKEGVLEKKTKTYEDKVNKLRDEFNDRRDLLTARFHGGAEGDKEMYEQANAAFDADILRITKKMKGATLSDKAELQDKIVEIEKNRDLLAREIKPLSEESYKRELASIDGVYKRNVRDARDKFRKEVGKTTIQGAYELFAELENIMSFKDVNLSKTKEFGDGEVASLESFVKTPNQANPEQEMIIRASFIRNLDKFMQGFESLEPRTAKVLKMHLGLDETNELYAHGLWGVPMGSKTEIVKNLPKGFYPKMDNIDVDFQKRLKNWKKKKPQRIMTMTRTASEIKKREQDLKDWTKRRNKAKKEISRKISKVKGAVAKQKFRELTYKKHKSTMAKKPTNIKTKNRRLNDKELKALTVKWRKNKPILNKELGNKAIYARVSRDLELGKIALAEILPKKVYKDLMSSYSDMRAYNIRKSHLKEDLIKSMVVDTFLGFKLEYKKEETIVTKAFNKIRSITNYLFGE